MIGTALGFLLVTIVTAGSWMSSSPLYTVRMEQASSEMNFLPTALSGFTYVTEKGHMLDYCCSNGYCGMMPLGTSTGSICDTCYPICDETQEYTCYQTSCQSTCYTCSTCSTCPGQWTCPNTCRTCFSTCPYTCCTCKVCETTEPSCL
jgi:hypothetical protein